MVTRRDFIKNSAVVAMGMNMPGLLSQAHAASFKSNRPAANKRTFVSTAVDETIKKVKAQMKDPELAWMFENCYPNTLDTTVDYEVIDGKPDTFIITGDIDAMWLRDSTCQVWPYMPLIKQDKKLASDDPGFDQSPVQVCESRSLRQCVLQGHEKGI